MVPSPTTKCHIRITTKRPSTLERLDQEVKLKDVAAACGVDPATVWRWKNQRQVIQDAKPDQAYIGEKRQPSAISPETERSSTVDYCVYPLYGHFNPVYAATRTSDAVKMFIIRFLRRNRLTYRRITHRGKVARGGMQIVADHFAAATVHLIESKEFLSPGSNAASYDFVYNMDQTSVCLDMSPKSSIGFTCTQSVDGIQSTTPDSFRASVFLCASATGKKMRPLIGFAGVHGADEHDELRAERSLFDWDKAHFTVQPKAYCDQRVMQEWIDGVWSPDGQGPSVSLLDSLKTHKMDGVKTSLEDEGHTKVVYVPPWITGIAQPMNVAVVKPFEDRCRDPYVKFVREDGLFSTSTQKIAAVVVQAWEEVKEESIVNGFLKAGLIAIGPRDASGVFASPEPKREGIVDVE
ncbi:LOW QUALITY PROTEIN: hypothetical protein PHPALM_28303 [Phytophthora palmivora]|uniref:DDE-1 domain-containing protein n=1 Tax=Phytophthora palmivora TaxID=4796 RepID=A0A2P4XAE3_9STRA|nr:LOW QUALITY PROTEIN: hypothetical protein PHPALM_28303 [Phytophthora palmivora]